MKLLSRMPLWMSPPKNRFKLGSALGHSNFEEGGVRKGRDFWLPSPLAVPLSTTRNYTYCMLDYPCYNLHHATALPPQCGGTEEVPLPTTPCSAAVH